MSVSQDIQPFAADDDKVRATLKDAHLPSLLPALAQNLGDLSLLREDLVPDTSPEMRAIGGYTEAQLAGAEEVAFESLKRLRDAGAVDAPALTDSDIHKLLQHLTGGELTEDYVPLLLEELDYPVKDARAPKWTKDSVGRVEPFSVVVVGAGMSGLLAGHRVNQAGLDFTIIEKNPDIGGTWYDNTYPGARVDNQNHMYSYSFAQKPDWPYFYSTGKVLYDYFDECTDQFGIRDRIRFNTEVLSADWKEDAAVWRIRVRGSDGAEETIEVNALITSTGQLNQPKLPDIPGQGSFEGPSFHSARWDHDVDLRGKRVAVIGNGASASQIIPEVAKEAGELVIFQRTPTWYAPVPNYHDAVPENLNWLFNHVPRYAQWYRFWIFWTSAEGLLPSAAVDEGWDGNPESIGAANDLIKEMFTSYMQAELADRPDLAEKVIPTYPPASKRIVLDNGIWAETLKRDNVELLTDKIDEITPRGVRTTDGMEHAADVVIYATGFQASRFLAPMAVHGRNGIDLNEQWDGDARAYLGVTIPNFPNFFMTYGPNTNIVVNGSTVYFAECEVTYIMECLRMMLKGGHRSLDCRQDAHDSYNEWIDKGNLGMAWGVAEVPSWYRSESGRSAQNWPYSMLEFWQQTREAKSADYQLV
jgi:4-hydroxyacetophenone monooxygenase